MHEIARESVLQRLRASDYHDWSKGWPGSPFSDLKDEELVERLILEVKASIECENAGGDWIFDCTGLFNGTVYPEYRADKLCQTCEARAALEAVPA